MRDVQAYAERKNGIIDICITANLTDSCAEASVQDQYPGGKITYVKDPGAAQVFIEEKRVPGSAACLAVLSPWGAHVEITDDSHDKVEIFVNGILEVTVSVIDKGQDYIVIESVYDSDDCLIVPSNSFYPAIYRQAFGPASFADCTTWVSENCSAKK